MNEEMIKYKESNNINFIAYKNDHNNIEMDLNVYFVDLLDVDYSINRLLGSISAKVDMIGTIINNV